MKLNESTKDLIDLGVEYDEIKIPPFKIINACTLGYLNKMSHEEMEPLIDDICNIIKKQDSIKHYRNKLEDYSLKPADIERFYDINFAKVVFRGGTEKFPFALDVYFTFNEQNHFLQIGHRRQKQDEATMGSRSNVTEYLLDTQPLGETVEHRKNLTSRIKAAIDHSVYMAEAEKFAQDNKQRIGEFLLGLIENDPIVNIFGNAPTFSIELTKNTELSHLKKMLYPGAPTIVTTLKNTMPSGAEVSTSIKGDVFYIPGNRFGLFGYTKEERRLMSGDFQSENGQEMIMYFDRDGTEIKNPVYKVNLLDSKIMHTTKPYSTSQKANDANLVMAENIGETSNFLLDVRYDAKVNDDHSISITVDLSPKERAKYHELLKEGPSLKSREQFTARAFELGGNLSRYKPLKDAVVKIDNILGGN